MLLANVRCGRALFSDTQLSQHYLLIDLSATLVLESSEIAVIFPFFSLWYFWKAEVFPLALSITAVIPPLSFLGTTQVSAVKTSLCSWVPGLGRCASLVTHGCCAIRAAWAVPLRRAQGWVFVDLVSLCGGEREFLWH